MRIPLLRRRIGGLVHPNGAWMPPVDPPPAGATWPTGSFVIGAQKGIWEEHMLGGRPLDVITTFQTRDQGWPALCWGSSPIDDNPGYTGKLDIAYPFHPDGEGSIAEVAAGDFDQEWTWVAQQIATWGDERIYVRLAWEFNIDVWTHTVTNVSDWIAAWRRVAGIIKTHAPDAQMVWCINGKVTHAGHPPSGDAWDCYPGDDVVDVIAIDNYDFYPYIDDETTWNTTANDIHGVNYVAAQARTRGKGFAVPEWGIVNGTGGGGDNTLYLQKMFDLFAANADILEYECYFTDPTSGHIGGQLVDFSNPSTTPANPDSADLYRSLWIAPADEGPEYPAQI